MALGTYEKPVMGEIYSSPMPGIAIWFPRNTLLSLEKSGGNNLKKEPFSR